ncbi:conserved hypothetical protein [Desulforapulum autotrophicum HRM2]|uniref:Damage-control phosphatase ARMT1-like metal-binding domain-containing protein n=2 Tax=Desulforapulum autotrophicum TaxID=2296 RepID=C0QLK6_DESAH|nr:conserved hypothetical protein [Desulforapulum autotrophicum HRM2]
MKTYNDCIPCLVRQALGAARFVTADEKIHQTVLKKSLAAMAVMDMNQSPPMMARCIQTVIAEVTGNKDPYKEIKKQCNAFCLDQLDGLRAMVERSEAPLETAIRLSIAGNIIDFGAFSAIDTETIFDTIDYAMANKVTGDMDNLLDRLVSANAILWIADNAGEIVFDRLVLEKMDMGRVVFVVRGGPALNDATLEDAVETGITDIVTTIGSGGVIPGTVLDMCSPVFLQAFDRADLIIAKGQGNYETLPHDDDRIFFLFKAKCPVVAESAGVNLNDMVVRKGLSDR